MFYIINQATAMIGYDCGTKILNLTTISLLEVGPCDLPKNNATSVDVNIQLLQIVEFASIPVVQCKLEVHREVHKCSVFDYLLPVENGIQQYIHEIGRDACQLLHQTGNLKFMDQHIITNVRVNQSQTFSLTFAGSASDSSCNGAPYADFYGSWTKVLVQGTLKITLTAYTAQTNLDNDRIHLKSGVTCRMSDTMCLDTEGGNTFWSALPEDRCNTDRYSLIYEGKSTKVSDKTMLEAQALYTLESKEITFALTVKGFENVCGNKLIRTEHPKLVLLETSNGFSSPFSRKFNTVQNLDLFMYVNNKFVYTDRHQRKQMTELYMDVVQQRCNLERETIKNSLAIASFAPDEYAYHLMKETPGYTSVVSGEVIHVMKCVPVEVQVMHGEECYTQLQVSWKNSTYFLTPRTHILLKRGTQVTCNPMIPSYYKVGSSWYPISPKPVLAVPPMVINPQTELTWQYKDPVDLANSGIYSSKDLENLRDHINFPLEKPALLNSLVRGMTGKATVNQGGSLVNLFNQEEMEKLAQGAWDRLWAKFVNFGTVSAGVIAILMICQFIKLIIDTIIRCYTLHTVFGWSFRLLGAVFASITQLFMHLSRTPSPSAPDLERGETAPLNDQNIYPTINSKPSPALTQTSSNLGIN